MDHPTYEQLAERVASLEATEHHIRNMTLEEAAMVCDGLSKIFDQNVGYDVGYTTAATRGANEIRALKSTAPQPVEAAKGGEPVACDRTLFSSRICDMGTRGCHVAHQATPPAPTVAPSEVLASISDDVGFPPVLGQFIYDVNHGKQLDATLPLTKYIDKWHAAQAAAAPVMAVPEGWKLVPIVPTDEMAQELGDISDKQWRRMLSVAPIPDAPTTEGGEHG